MASPISEKIGIQTFGKILNSTFSKFPAAARTAVKVLSVSSSPLHLNAAFARAHAQPAHFKAQCYHLPSLVQPTEQRYRQFLLPPPHSTAIASGSGCSASSELLLLQGAFFMSATYSTRRWLFCCVHYSVTRTYQFSVGFVAFLRPDVPACRFILRL